MSQIGGSDNPAAVPASARAGVARVWCGFFAVALLLYATTADRGVQWQDSGWQQLRIVTGELSNVHGLPLTHPVQFYLGRLAIRIPALEPAFATTLLSAIAAAIAIANVAAILWILIGRILPCAIATTALMLAHTFWQHATHTESYALVAATLTGEWLCLTMFAVRGRGTWLIGAGFLNGLGIAIHLLALLSTPVNLVILVWALRSKRCTASVAIGACAAGLLGSIPYTALVIWTAAQSGDLPGALHNALFGQYATSVFNTTIGLRSLALSAGYILYNFPGIILPVALWGMIRPLDTTSMPRWLRRVLVCELLLFGAFVIRYSITDQYTYYFPIYILLAIFAGLGLHHAMDMKARGLRRLILALATASAICPPAVYAATATVLRSRGMLSRIVGNKPYRDGYRSFFIPWGVGEDGPERLNRDLANLVGADGVILSADRMIGFGIRYAIAVGRVPDSVAYLEAHVSPPEDEQKQQLSIVAEALRDGRPVILVPRNRDEPEVWFGATDWERDGDIYRLIELAHGEQ